MIIYIVLGNIGIFRCSWFQHYVFMTCDFNTHIIQSMFEGETRFATFIIMMERSLEMREDLARAAADGSWRSHMEPARAARGLPVPTTQAAGDFFGFIPINNLHDNIAGMATLTVIFSLLSGTSGSRSSTRQSRPSRVVLQAAEAAAATTTAHVTQVICV